MTALDSLAGLSVGDAFGAQFFATENRPLLLDKAAVPTAPWPWTDDTEMACNLVDVLHRFGRRTGEGAARRRGPAGGGAAPQVRVRGRVDPPGARGRYERDLFSRRAAVWDVISGPSVVALAPLPALVGVIALLAVVFHTGQGGSRLRLGGAGNNAPHTVNRDDDRLYRWGLFYFNRDDPALFVPKRFGIGWTVNMARPLTWVMLGATVAAIVIGPLAH